jgi:hypothetical protein
MKEPWEMTAEEFDAQRLDRIASLRHQLRIMDAVRTQRIPGNLTRKRDNTALAVAAKGGAKYRRRLEIERRIAKLESPEAVAAMPEVRRMVVAAALKSGKPVPLNVLAELGLT